MKKESAKKIALKKAEELGIKIKIVKPSGKIYFPEKLEQANKILSNMKFTHVK